METIETASENILVGQFCETPDGHRVLVERLVAEAGSSSRAIVKRVEGPKAGTRSSCFLSSLTPVGREIHTE
jgi:hypothetical protein